MSAQVQASSKLARFMQSETGPKTIHFWAPVMKWALVIAGINDTQKPVETLSSTQQIALFGTGVIWTRWCMIIKPKNYLLASVNFFLGGVAGYQLTRIYRYQQTLGLSATENLKTIVTGNRKEFETSAAKVEPASQ